MNKPRYIYVIDAYSGDTGIEEALQKLGFEYWKEFYVDGPEHLQFLIKAIEQNTPRDGSENIKSDKLLVFMSTVYGSVRPAAEIAKTIKSLNPNAKIVFRSTGPGRCDPNENYNELYSVFDDRMDKEYNNHPRMTQIVKEFFGI